jgi:hypothetical protein
MPTTTPNLLRVLGTNEASVSHQRESIRHWLTENPPPVRPLMLSLRANGYGILLAPVKRRGPISATNKV